MAAAGAPWTVYVGTYGPAERETLFRLRAGEDGSLEVASALAGIESPAFLALHPRGPWLYAASERGGGAEGEVWALGRTAGGDLVPRERRPAHGRATCHVAVDPAGRFLFAANYGGPTVVAYALGSDGLPGREPLLFRHAGSGAHPRQDGPHPHSVNVEASGRFAYGPDLGTDAVHVYRIGPGGAVRAAGAVAAPPGSGPRHLAFHPTLGRVYVVGELDSTVTVFPWDRASGALGSPLQRISTLPAGGGGAGGAAHLAFHPSGAFLYASNRGHDSIAVFRVGADGSLQAAGHAGSGGRIPRHFAISPDGGLLLAGNQESDAVVSFRVAADGGLEETGARAALPRPACILFAP